MNFFFKTTKSRVFVLQDDSRLGSACDISNPKLLDHVTNPFFVGEMEGGSFLHPTFSRFRVRLFLGLVFVCISLFICRAVQLQVIQGKDYTLLAEGNRHRIEHVVPARGTIFDQDGNILASNEPTFTVTMTIADIPDDTAERNAAIAKVANLSGLQPTDIDLLISNYASRPYEPIPVKENVPYEQAMRLAIEVADIPGFDLHTSTRRVYESTLLSLAHIIGYTGLISSAELEEHPDYQPIDNIGKLGVEYSYESLLRGIPGKIVYEVDARGNKQSIVSKTDPVTGADISLGIDLDFQKYIEQSLQNTLNNVGARRGCVVALDPQTGSVRALVSLPGYNANVFVGGIDKQTYTELLEDEDKPLFNRAISGEYPSGSIFKPVMAYAALTEGIINEHTSFLSTGGIGINEWFFPDWKAGGHGITDVRKAIAESVNTFFYIIGGGYDTVTGLGVERITEYAKKFGFGSQTGIDLPGEQDGFLPSKEWKEDAKGEKWYVGDTYHLSIGQGDFLTTPLQMAVETSIIANNGKIFEPHLVENVDGYGSVDLNKGVGNDIDSLNAYSLEVVRQGMRETVTSGSALSLSALSKAVAGKTGTAQTPGDRPYHSWFTGFGPYDDPNLALVVLVEEGGESNYAAVPLAKQIFQWWFQFGS